MTNGDQPDFTPTEIARRRTALEQAEHSGNMEGLYISGAARVDGEDYATGRIDVDELVARGRARYGLS
jgi:Antitoxin VbhA